jgi:hypothetical protein
MFRYGAAVGKKNNEKEILDTRSHERGMGNP